MSTEQMLKTADGEGPRSFAFGPFHLDAQARQLFRDGKVVPLAPKTAELLVLLVRRHGELVTKETVMGTIWPALFVEDTNLAQHISRLRKTLGDGLESATYIDTVPRRGYRFVAEVVENAAPGIERRAGPSSPRRQHTVGRARERAELLEAFEAVRSGCGLMVGVSGEPGMGKTTVVEEFLSDLETEGVKCSTARGRCSERLAGTEAYLPVLEALESLLQDDPGGSALRLMKSVAPTWYGRMTPGAELAQAATQDQLKRELSTFFRELTHVRPVVVFIEDLHWAGASTVETLAHLGTRLAAMRLLLVVTYRLEELRLTRHPFLTVKQELQARGACRELPLEFLSEENIAQYVFLEFRDHQFPAAFPGLIHARTEGSPLFVVDLLRSLRARGVIVQEDGRWGLAEGVPDLARELPESVRAMIERKIGQLDDADNQLLVAASVQGEEFDAAVIAAVLAMDPDHVERRLYVLDHEFGFVRQVSEHDFPDGTLALRYRFVHVLYQNAFYGSLTPARKAALSGKVAVTLLLFYGDRSSEVASELALLFEAARDPARAVDCYVRALEAALRVFAYHEVEQLARRGLALVDGLADTPERAEQELALLNGLSASLIATKGYTAQEVKDVCTRVRDICADRAPTDHIFPALYGLSAFHQGRAEYRIARQWADELLSRAESRGDPALVVEGHSALGDLLIWTGDFQSALLHLEQAIARDDPRPHGSGTSLTGFDPAVRNRILRAVVLSFLGYPDQAVGASREAIALARNLSEPPSLVWALFFGAVMHQLRREAGDCRERTEEALDLCGEHGLADFVGWASFWRGWALATEGRAEEGIALMRESLAGQEALGARVCRSMMLALLAAAYERAGRTDEGLAAADEGLNFANQTGEGFYHAELHRIKGELLLRRGTESSVQVEAEACFREAMNIARLQSARLLELRAAMSLCRLWRKEGRTAEARRTLSSIYDQLNEGFDTADLQEGRALLSELS